MSWNLPPGWADVLSEELRQPYFARLQAFVEHERQHGVVYPASEDVFAALAQTRTVVPLTIPRTP